MLETSKRGFEVHFGVKGIEFVVWMEVHLVGSGAFWVLGFNWRVVMPCIEMGKR